MTVANVDRYGYEEHPSANRDRFVADKSPWKQREIPADFVEEGGVATTERRSTVTISFHWSRM
ncbi:hypothetical protein FHS26_005905 [Rhizobium pisi]|uniref:Uncharacterized protein n=1 Tax=Rhizobium pisi TaxID=574561 RepID=A0A4R0CHZ7_9HYPH|nr:MULTISPECIES: hypothetical protein [Rhizobium]MBB3138127.1 hypothetical protein [Rhizobium pisi]TAV45393.1 hypothetical protein ELI31_26390 [Rhizobium leguminosarum]TAV45951.1 hypothetical protein ELI32_27700 [Rhizobium leguminosarum]TAV63806.1 hypothetical protein ELI30_27470 [Rhizobium leguminosarum]TBF22848.1 hypothetical protein ELG93_35190 [Rhizobium ruizarguesonis]